MASSSTRIERFEVTYPLLTHQAAMSRDALRPDCEPDIHGQYVPSILNLDGPNKRLYLEEKEHPGGSSCGLGDSKPGLTFWNSKSEA